MLMIRAKVQKNSQTMRVAMDKHDFARVHFKTDLERIIYIDTGPWMQTPEIVEPDIEH